METKKSKSQSKKEKLHEIRSENARREKRDARGRFTSSDKSSKKSQSKKAIQGEIDVILVDDGIDCGCGL